jgi:hypothetical protein
LELMSSTTIALAVLIDFNRVGGDD